MSVKIVCPSCGRVLGDTDHSIDCRMNCRGCKKTVHIKMKVANYADYIKFKPEKEAK